jgi:hypothetical protein
MMERYIHFEPNFVVLIKLIEKYITFEKEVVK